MDVLVKAKAIKLWKQTGEVDVEVIAGGQVEVLTLDGTLVIKPPIYGHLSDCDLHNLPAYPPKPCSCGKGIGQKDEL